MSAIDKVLDVLDVGLQSSNDTGYGTDRSPEKCARCQKENPAEDGDLCSGCRAFLLGDSTDDPRVRASNEVLPPVPQQWNYIPVTTGNLTVEAILQDENGVEQRRMALRGLTGVVLMPTAPEPLVWMATDPASSVALDIRTLRYELYAQQIVSEHEARAIYRLSTS